MAATAKADRPAVDRPSAGRRLTTETKSAVKTTEFMAMVAIVAGILISAAVINGGDTQGTDAFIARQAWLYVAIVAAGYMISRGLAKSGSGEPYFNDGTNDNRGHDGHRPDGVSSSAR